MLTDKAIAGLLEFACPSIKYRINSEILGRSGERKDMLELQRQILLDTLVHEVMNWRQADGWLGWDFHGAKSIETGVRLLCEKGLQRHHPVLARALQALEDHPERLDRGIGKVGEVLDERGFGGSQMIRAAVFAHAGVENRPFIKKQVAVALASFQAVRDVTSLEALVEEYKNKLVFKPGVTWPSIYHLRLLAFTHGWRTASHRRTVVEAVRRLVELSPLPRISVRHKSQIIAPASFGMQDFNPEMGSMDAADWMMWFHRMECLARLGIVHLIPALQRQVAILAGMLEGETPRFTRKLTHPYFTKWGAYTGLMLERDWRASERRENDLTFRSLMIEHYVTLGKESIGWSQI
jgi:hypothetical protein